MEKLIKHYITQVLIGFMISGVFVAGLLYFNVMNLWYLVTHSADGILAVFMLWLFNGIVFAGVQFAISIMRMKDDDDDEPRGGHRQRLLQREPQLIPIRVEARPRDPFSAKR
ncbi:hypothetical protein [Planktotalea sp.]|uniref:hypothetical protein n=1 Tax=Planktotalea sp. TaxID=2029877 RepID=UPI003D6BCB47